MRVGLFLFFGSFVLVYFFVIKLIYGGFYEFGSFKVGFVLGKCIKVLLFGDKFIGIFVNYGFKIYFFLIYLLWVVK